MKDSHLNLASHRFACFERWFLHHSAIIPCQCSVLILPRKACAFVGQSRSNHSLYVISNIMA